MIVVLIKAIDTNTTNKATPFLAIGKTRYYTNDLSVKFNQIVAKLNRRDETIAADITDENSKDYSSLAIARVRLTHGC